MTSSALRSIETVSIPRKGFESPMAKALKVRGTPDSRGAKSALSGLGTTGGCRMAKGSMAESMEGRAFRPPSIAGPLPAVNARSNSSAAWVEGMSSPRCRSDAKDDCRAIVRDFRWRRTRVVSSMRGPVRNDRALANRTPHGRALREVRLRNDKGIVASSLWVGVP
jgi:hypothetical protein